jgi:hypothetical protein
MLEEAMYRTQGDPVDITVREQARAWRRSRLGLLAAWLRRGRV